MLFWLWFCAEPFIVWSWHAPPPPQPGFASIYLPDLISHVKTISCWYELQQWRTLTSQLWEKSDICPLRQAYLAIFSKFVWFQIYIGSIISIFLQYQSYYCISPCMHAISIRWNVLHSKIYAGISISPNKAPTLVLPIIVMMGDKSIAYQLWTLKGVDYIQTYTFFNVKNSFCELFFGRVKPFFIPAYLSSMCYMCSIFMYSVMLIGLTFL